MNRQATFAVKSFSKIKHIIHSTKADKLTTARTISVAGAVVGSGSFDGSANVTIPTIGSGADGSFTTVDGKTVTVVDGIITAIT